MKPLYHRNVHDGVVEALGDTRIVLVAGARQVGKTTLTRAISSGPHPMRALTLDDRATRDAAITDPTGFVSGLDGPVLIDEIQRAPDLLLAIKDDVDRDTTPGRYLLTGSTNLLAPSESTTRSPAESRPCGCGRWRRPRSTAAP